MTGTTQNGQKHFIFIVVRHLRIAGETGFVKKRIVKYIEGSNSNNDNITETLNNHSDDSICWVVMVIMII